MRETPTAYPAANFTPQDFHFFMELDVSPHLLEVFLSDICVQICTKTIVDYTGLVQYRGPGVLGGAYWTFNMALALGSTFVATHVYFALTPEGEAAADEASAWLAVGAMCAAWAAVFGAFLLLIKPGHAQSFFSTETGREWVRNKFLREGASDECRFFIHTMRGAMWADIRGEVKEWTLGNWERWDATHPEWFTPAAVAAVDDDMIPERFLRRLRSAGGGERDRRKSSLAAFWEERSARSGGASPARGEGRGLPVDSEQGLGEGGTLTNSAR
jgi:hypothetical protein